MGVATSSSETKASQRPFVPNQQVLYDLLRALIEGRDIAQVSEILYSQLRRMLPLHRLGIAFISEDGRFFVSKVNISERPIWLREGFRALVKRSSLKGVIDTGSPRIINNLETYLKENPGSISTRMVVNEGMRSNISIPLKAENKPIGILFLASVEPDTYQSEHVELLIHVSHVLSLTLEKALLLDRLKVQQQTLLETLAEKEGLAIQLEQKVEDQSVQLEEELEVNKLLLKVASHINEGFTLEQVFAKAFAVLQESFDFECATLVHFLRAEQQGLVSGSYPGEESGKSVFARKERIELKGSLLNEIFLTHKPLIQTDLSKRRYSEDESFDRAGMKAYLSAPLLIKGHPVGAFYLACADEEKVLSIPERLLEGLSLHLAVAFNHAHIFDGVVANEKFLRLQNQHLMHQLAGDRIGEKIIGSSEAIREIKRSIAMVAKADSTVLILGETGTGKELVARAIHEESSRSDHPLISVNCAALAPSIIESELFGHQKGAFTGAYREKVGRFELAHNGTLFLDEIGELNLNLQSKILRVLQEGTFERVGGTVPIKTNTRIIAATNRDLRRMVQENRFREDLFYRLNVFPLFIPPLRNRPDDVVTLVEHFLKFYGKKFQRPALQLDSASKSWATKYGWPGNVRELQNMVERAIIISQGQIVSLVDSANSDPAAGEAKSHIRAITEKALKSSEQSWEQWERQVLEESLRRCQGKIYGVDGAAASLKLRPTTLQGKLRKHGIQPKFFQASAGAQPPT